VRSPKKVVLGLESADPELENGYPLGEQLILAQIKGEWYPCAGAATRTRGE